MKATFWSYMHAHSPTETTEAHARTSPCTLPTGVSHFVPQTKAPSPLRRFTLSHQSHIPFPHAERAFFFLFAVIKLWQYTDIFLATMNNTPSSRPHGKSTWASVNTASYLTGKMRCCEAYERACELKRALMRVFSLWWQAHSTIGVDALIYVVRGKRVRGGGVRWLKSLSAQLYCLECRVCHHSNRKEIFFLKS